jgi:hypothetical protein
MSIGWIVTAVAVATLMFGPSEIYYNRYTGMTPFELILMNPGPILTVGLFCVAGGTRLRAKGGMSRESYLQAHYQFISDDGRDVSGQVYARDLGNDNFHISLAPPAV